MIIQEDNRWKVVILFLFFKKKKKKRRMRILSTVFFFAGKFYAFEQILLTEPIMKKLEHAH